MASQTASWTFSRLSRRPISIFPVRFFLQLLAFPAPPSALSPACVYPLPLVLAPNTGGLSPAVIYLKNRVNRAWERTDYYPNETLIYEDEKARFRERLLPILASAQNRVRHQLVPILQRILHFDFPEKWPSFMDYTLQLLNTNDPRSVLAGLQCLLAVCRAYRFKASNTESRDHFDKIIEASFPRLLTICNELVNQESDEAGEMLHIALKCYKHATWVRPCLMIAVLAMFSVMLTNGQTTARALCLSPAECR